MNAASFIFIFLTNLLFAASSVLFKIATNHVGKIELTSITSLVSVAGRLIVSPYVIGGIAASSAGTICYFVLLSRFNLSIVYPLLSIAYLFVAVAGVFFLKESISIPNWLGIILICAGVALISVRAH